MSHPCHKAQLTSLRRIEGQLRGIAKMIEEEKYCIDILNQIKAVRNSIATVEGKILKTHLKECVKESLDGSQQFEDKVEELLKVLKR
ncbi:metal-sensitive transcriptional regulator [Gammaproteobacteria bacterium]|nr:metal-sensitive transcriptional regulator [Gammaproteobacteria bacterium]